MVIGSHGVTHTLLTRLSENQIKKEINDGFKFVKQYTDLKTFCFPYGGKKSYNRIIINHFKKLHRRFVSSAIVRLAKCGEHGLAIRALQLGLAPAPGTITSARLKTTLAGIALPLVGLFGFVGFLCSAGSS